MSATSMKVVATPASTPAAGDWGLNSTYNLTLRLGSLFSLPSRFIAKWRRFDDLLQHDGVDEHALAAAAAVCVRRRLGVAAR